MLKEKIIKYFARYFYPQNIFANYIISELDQLDDEKYLVDAPCGNGETSWHFSKRSKLNVIGVDNNEESIYRAKFNFNSNNLNYILGDIIEETNKLESFDYYCVINSLFLLNDVEVLLNNVYAKINEKGKLFVILPNIDGKNYKWFNLRNKNYNKLKLKKEEFAAYFNLFKFHVVKVNPIAYAHHYGRIDTKLLSIFSHFYLRILNYFQSILHIGSPNYFLIVCEKQN